MVDPAARKSARDVLKMLVLGKATSYKCENEFVELYSYSHDPVIFALFRTVFEIGGDDDKSLAYIFVRGGEMRKRVCRWILFLKTDLEYEWPEDRMAPGIRDFYKPNWFDKLFLLEARIIRSNENFIKSGDYQVWPFFRQADLDSARTACAQCKASHRDNG